MLSKPIIKPKPLLYGRPAYEVLDEAIALWPIAISLYAIIGEDGHKSWDALKQTHLLHAKANFVGVRQASKAPIHGYWESDGDWLAITLSNKTVARQRVTELGVRNTLRYSLYGLCESRLYKYTFTDACSFSLAPSPIPSFNWAFWKDELLFKKYLQIGRKPGAKFEAKLNALIADFKQGKNFSSIEALTEYANTI